jgi:hypothetical protein
MRKIHIIIIAQSIVVVKLKSLDIVLYFAHATIFGRKLSFAIFKQGLKNTTFGIEINTKKTA